MLEITLTETEFIKNPNTKTTYLLASENTEIITEKNHYLSTNDETCKFFRSKGGTETRVMSYTCAGYKCTKLTSLSPDRQRKIVRKYSFKTVV
jgi:hypothetical protein